MKTIEVVAAIIVKGNKVFATQRGHGEYKGYFEFPGGKIEPDETKEQALIREIREELNTAIVIDSHAINTNFDYPDFHLDMDCYWCKLDCDNYELLEHMSAKWVSKKEIDTLQWLPADEEVIKLIKETP
mgnify:CR=1 FL=1